MKIIDDIEKINIGDVMSGIDNIKNSLSSLDQRSSVQVAELNQQLDAALQQVQAIKDRLAQTRDTTREKVEETLTLLSEN
jgi:outer membrane murein-binding lipoprotein Lpp